MSRTTDYILDEEAKGNIIFNGKEYERTDKMADLVDKCERAKYELKSAEDYLNKCKDSLGIAHG